MTDNATAISSIFKFPETFPELPALAKRLGVEPNTGNGRVKLSMNDGTTYDLFALVNAFLDRIDQGGGQ